MKVKFAHLSDVHLGAWRNENLNLVGYEAFTQAIDKIIEENVDFVIISGDLYDISNPKVDVVDLAVKKLKELYNKGIPVYGIMGSHDFSPSEKSMIRPLISADFFVDVSQGKMEENELKLKFTEDPKTKIKFTGIRARKRSLEIEDYQLLDKGTLEKEPGIKIFVLHTMLQELKPLEYKDMESAPKSVLPEGFIYYAGGHLHKTVPESLREKSKIQIDENKKIIYPGCLFPTNFKELEQFKYGGFCIISGEIDGPFMEAQYIPMQLKEVVSLILDCNDKSVENVLTQLDDLISKTDFEDKLTTIRFFGMLSSGKSFEIKTSEIIEKIKSRGAYEVLVNKSALSTKEYSSVRVSVGKTNEEIENILIHEHAQKSQVAGISKKQLERKIHDLISILGKEREEGTKVREYNDEILKNFIKIFDLEQAEE